jgi:ArsR family transcriptional regulator
MKRRKHQPLSQNALQLVAARFRLLAEPLRLEILQHLRSGELSVSEIVDATGSTQPNISKHLRLLQDAGMVARRQEGNTVHYSISDPSVFELCDLVCGSLRSSLAERTAMFA